MTRLILKFQLLAAAALCVALTGCSSEEEKGSGQFPVGGSAGAGATGGTAGTVAGVGGTAGTVAGVGGTAGTVAGTGGVAGTVAGSGGAAGDVGGAGGVAGMSMMSGGEGGTMAGASGMTGGTAGTMAGEGGTSGMGGDPTAACIADFVAAGDTMECAMCACGMCLEELGLCTEDTLPAPNPNVTKTSGEVCQEIIECAGANNCSGDACWCGCTTGPGCCDTQYMMMGPCKFEINQGGSMADFLGGGIAGPGQTHYPSPDDKNPGPGHPIGNANVVGACIAEKCAACQ